MDAKHHSNQGDKYFKSQNYLKAIESFDKALEAEPNYSYFHYMKGNALYKLRRCMEAIVCYEDAINNDESEIECKLKNFCFVPTCDPNHQVNSLAGLEDFFFMKGKAYMHVKKYDESVFCFEKAIQIKPRTSIYHYMQGKALFLSSLYFLAANSFKIAAKINPNDPDSYYMYGLCLYKSTKQQNVMTKKQLDHILKYFDKSIKLNPNDSNSYSAKGKLFLIVGRYDEAIEYFSKAIERNVREGAYYNLRGQIYMKIEAWTEAAQDFRDALEIKPHDKICSNYLRESLEHLKKATSIKYRTVMVASDLTTEFLSSAVVNTLNNIETCGILAGKLNENIFTITHCILPKQSGTSDTCTTREEHELVETVCKHDLITLGWIHTHPSQTAFLSSIDMHTHYGYQIQTPEAIAIVCAPSIDDIKYFTLTLPKGMKEVGECNEIGFHPHSRYLFKECQHVKQDSTLKAEIIDLRNNLTLN